MPDTKVAEMDKIPLTPTDPDGPQAAEGDVIGASLAKTEPEPKTEPKSEPKKAEEKPPEKQAWDKEQQHKDEIRAAQKRETALQDQMAETEQKSEKLQAQLAELEAKKARGEDYDFEKFESVAEAVKNLMQDVSTLRSDLRQNTETMQKKLDDVGTQSSQAQKTAKNAAGERALDTACKPLDAQYGAQHRNEVISLVNAKFDRLQIGLLPEESQREWALENLESNYKQLSAADKPVEGERVDADPILDTNQGGSPVHEKPVKIQEGTLDSVVEQYQQAHSGKKG